jgi:hypothetical protein
MKSKNFQKSQKKGQNWQKKPKISNKAQKAKFAKIWANFGFLGQFWYFGPILAFFLPILAFLANFGFLANFRFFGKIGIFWKILDFLKQVAVCHFGGYIYREYMTQSRRWCEGTYVANSETYRVGSEKPRT